MTYTAKMLEHFNNPRNCGALFERTTEGASGKPGQGNYMVLHILLAGKKIIKTAFKTHGCAGAIACGSAISEMIRGMTVEEARAVTRDDVDSYLDGLPLGKGHCADLAASALADALAKLSI